MEYRLFDLLTINYQNMKKAFFISAALLICGLSQAQSITKKSKGTFKTGIRSGVNVTTTSIGIGGTGTAPNGKPLFKKPNYRIGYTIGSYFHFPISNNIAFQPELTFSTEGSVQDGLIGNINDNVYAQVFKLKFTYIQVPLLLKYRSKSGFFVEGGPQIGLLTRASLTNKYPSGVNQPPTTGVTSSIKSSMKSSNVALALGVGYEFSKAVGIGVRYNAGLTDVYTASNIDMKNRGFFLSAHFNLSK